MAGLESANIGEEKWPISGVSIIFDSGSSVNHIPVKEYNILLAAITRDHQCQTQFTGYETYYCECDGVNDPTYPTLSLHSGATTLNFKP